MGVGVSKSHTTEFRLASAMQELGKQDMVPITLSMEVAPGPALYSMRATRRGRQQLAIDLKVYPPESDFNLATHESTAITSRKPQKS